MVCKQVVRTFHDDNGAGEHEGKVATQEVPSAQPSDAVDKQDVLVPRVVCGDALEALPDRDAKMQLEAGYLFEQHDR